MPDGTPIDLDKSAGLFEVDSQRAEDLRGAVVPARNPERGTRIDIDKLRSLHVGRIHRTRVDEGRRHPETGRAWKATTEDGSGLTTTEHDTPDDRVDALVRPATVRAVRNPSTGRLENT